MNWNWACCARQLILYIIHASMFTPFVLQSDWPSPDASYWKFSYCSMQLAVIPAPQTKFFSKVMYGSKVSTVHLHVEEVALCIGEAAVNFFRDCSNFFLLSVIVMSCDVNVG